VIAVVGGTDETDAAVPPARAHRAGVRSARQELQAGNARRHRADVAATVAVAGRPARRSVRRPADANPPAPDDPAPAGAPAVDLDVQRAGVRAALAELRRHPGPDRGPAGASP
jgi:hypothetical protein